MGECGRVARNLWVRYDPYVKSANIICVLFFFSPLRVVCVGSITSTSAFVIFIAQSKTLGACRKTKRENLLENAATAKQQSSRRAATEQRNGGKSYWKMTQQQSSSRAASYYGGP